MQFLIAKPSGPMRATRQEYYFRFARPEMILYQRSWALVLNTLVVFRWRAARWCDIQSEGLSVPQVGFIKSN